PPKAHDVSKAIDKANGETGRLLRFTGWMRETGLTARQIDEATETNMGGHYLTAKSQPAIPTRCQWAKLRPLCGDIPAWVDELVDRIEAEREVVGQDTKARSTSGKSALPSVGGETVYETWDITAPATAAAREWAGWGTALKPAWEPIIVARKPLEGTVAENVLRHGTGALNVDGCRVGTVDDVPSVHATRRSDYPQSYKGDGAGWGRSRGGFAGDSVCWEPNGGRWPANLIHDGSDEVVGLFPQTTSGSGQRRPKPTENRAAYMAGWPANGYERDGDSGSAARFFYCAKASKADREEGCEGLDEKELKAYGDFEGTPEHGPKKNVRAKNHHPTVKPTALMRYLCRLVTHPDGVVLDPFAGSGSTGKAAMLEGFRFIGIERDPEYAKIAEARISAALLPLEAIT
ncbi:site-specific DNA-methyltransferase, partial [bacterium]|nr:site-specific DNA-methyltransferase [bacterium]